MLKELMKERLNLAAEEIYNLFEVTIADYEEKLNRSKEEHERRESELVDAVAELRVRLLKRIKQDEALLFIKNEKEELECSTEADQLPPLLEAPQTEENDNAAILHEAKEYEDLPSEPESLFAPLSEADIKTSESSETYDSEDDKKLTKRDATKAAVEVRQDGVQVSGETGTRSDEQVQSADGKIPTETFENGDEDPKPRRDFDDFNCPQCEKTFYSKKGLKNHMPTHAPEVKLAPCSARKYSLKDFIKQEDDDDEFGVPSNLCDGEKGKKKPQNAKETEFQCSICQQVLENKAALKGHLREHKNELNFACDSCDQKFKRKEHLTRHLRVHVPRKESWRKRKFQDTICPQCGKMFDNGSKMLHHMAKCKRLACKVCGKRFSRRHNLLNHTAQNHKEENSTENQVSADGPPPSKTCERGQNGEDRRSGSDAGERSDVDGGEQRQVILKTKMKDCPKEGPPTSDSDTDFGQCVPYSSSRRKKTPRVNKRSRTKAPLPPQIPETEAGPGWKSDDNRCLICNKTYVSIGGLRRHMVQHTGSKAFACCVCDKRFGLQEYLTRHMMTHSARKCPICGERFATRSQMEVHMGTHGPHDRPPEKMDEGNGDQSPSDKT